MLNRVDRIVVSDRMRPVDPERVKHLAGSMQQIGLQTPISVHLDEEIGCVLVTGNHRLEAAKSLGWPEIECTIAHLDEIDRQIWEIDENLIRNALTPSQEAQHIKRRQELWMLRQESSGKTSPTAGGGAPGENKGFAAETEDLTGRSKRMTNLALSRAEVPADVMDRIQGTKLDTGVYLDALKKLEPQQMRVKVAKDLTDLEAKRPRKPVSPPDEALNGIEVVNKQLTRLVKAWNGATPEVREKFVSEYVDQSVFDATRAGDPDGEGGSSAAVETAKIVEAKHEGRAAALAGKLFTDNPYPTAEFDSASAWSDGYRMGGAITSIKTVETKGEPENGAPNETATEAPDAHAGVPAQAEGEVSSAAGETAPAGEMGRENGSGEPAAPAPEAASAGTGPGDGSGPGDDPLDIPDFLRRDQ